MNTKVLQLGNPILRQHSQEIPKKEFGSVELKQLEQDLFAIMQESNGIGLAAPQIGINRRVIVFGMETHSVYHSDVPIPYTVLFNPTYVPTSDLLDEDYEGCLSVVNIRGKVSRFKNIRYRGFDADGKLIEREVSDLHARVLQHECDHLDGIVFLDKISDPNSLGFHEELVKAGAFE